MSLTTASPFEPNSEARLVTFGLSTEILHNGLRPGGSRAANRTALALDSSPGTDIYHDGMEQLAQLLYPAGWRLVMVDRQPRLLHPERIVTFTISSGINVGQWNMRMPRTRRKGKATRLALAPPEPHPSLFGDLGVESPEELVVAAQNSPLYFLLVERTVGGNGLHIEFSRPSEMTDGGSVNNWADRIQVGFLDLEGDLSVFDNPDDGDEFDVPVEPR